MKREKLSADLLRSVEESIRLRDERQSLQVEYGLEEYGDIAFDPGRWYYKRQSSGGDNSYTDMIA